MRTKGKSGQCLRAARISHFQSWMVDYAPYWFGPGVPGWQNQ